MSKTARWALIVITLTLAMSVVAGSIFGERSLGSSEEEVVSRAARVVLTAIEWLPDERSSDELVYDGIDGMLETLDPHSNFLRPSSFKKMRERQEGSFFGVGIIISRRAGQVTVIAPIDGTPAAGKGLRAGDVISAVDGTETEDLSLDEVVELVRGPEGTDVTLTIARPGFSEPLEVTIERARIPTNSVRYAFMLRPGVGYVRLSDFSNTSEREVRQAIAELTDQGMERLVFDLRDNPGGTLDAAVGVSDLFLNEGQLIVSTRGRTPDSVTTIEAPGNGNGFNGPLVILVNAGSASASEIVAGAVQDHDRGLIIGEVTWGKGLVQTVYTVRDAGLALTTARYYTPAGRCIQRDYESFIDYITHRGTSDGEGSPDSTYTTDAGRTVTGGGGIAPDLDVPAEEIPEAAVRLYSRSAYFRFAVQIAQKIAEESRPEWARQLTMNDALLERFWSFVESEELLDPEDLVAARTNDAVVEAVGRALRVEALNLAIDLEAGYRLAIEGDLQVREALQSMPQADALWEAWRDDQGLDLAELPPIPKDIVEQALVQ
jgi:carboxyl-terminal processing protease